MDKSVNLTYSWATISDFDSPVFGLQCRDLKSALAEVGGL